MWLKVEMQAGASPSNESLLESSQPKLKAVLSHSISESCGGVGRHPGLTSCHQKAAFPFHISSLFFLSL